MCSDTHFEKAFRSFGLCIVSGRALLLRAVAAAALIFSETYGFEKSFYLRGGGFFSVTRTALRLLEETDSVFISCADFDAVAEAVADACGAVVRSDPPPGVITVNLFDEGFSVSRGDILVHGSDFSFSIPGLDFSGISAECIPALAESLEICGFLGNNELKTELLSK